MCSVLSRLTLWPHGLYPAKLLCLWNFPGKNTGAVCHFLLQGIFPAPGIAPRSAASLELVGRFFTASATWEAHYKLQSPCFTLGLQTIYLMAGSLYPLTKPFLFLPPLQLLAATFLLSVSKFNFFILYTWVRSFVCLSLSGLSSLT